MKDKKPIEIERKFLVKGDFKPFVVEQLTIKQGYLCNQPEKTVRIRWQNEQGYITIKGPANASGFSRFEWEKEISATEANQLLELCEKGVIYKIRHLVPYGGKTYEVDLFLGNNEGLIMAELELETEDEPFERPDWLGKEVTKDVRYYNAYLSQHPYSEWGENRTD